jgi:FixJ family two-component response regulator
VYATRPTVAVIEADVAHRRSLCALLSTLDVDIKDYDSAESFLAACDHDPGCLITEVALPGMSGLELLRLLRSGGQHQPIILLGEEEDVGAAVTALREGEVDFFEKPQVDTSITRRVAYLLDHCTLKIRH